MNKKYPHIANIISAVSLMIAICIGIYTVRDYGLNWDEPGNMRYGDLLRHYYATGQRDTTVFSFANLYYYGGAFDLTASIITRLSGWPIELVRHSFGLFIGVIGLILTNWCGRRIAGPWAGCITMLTILTLPLYWGHSFINSKDLPFAVASLAIAAALVSAFKSWPRPKPRHIIALGFALGLAFSLRVGAAVHGVTFLIIIALKVWQISRFISLKHALYHAFMFSLRLSPAIFIMVPIVAFFWPWVIQEPYNIVEALQLFSKFSFDGKELFNGLLRPAAEMPWYYVPILLIYQLPEIVVIGLPCVLVALLALRKRIKIPFSFHIILCFACVPLLWVLFTRPVLYNGIRHMIFIVPPLILTVCVGIDLLWRHLPNLGRWIIGILLVINLGANIHTSYRLHPYQYLAFNHFIGGVKGAQNKFALDYWGLSLKEAVAELSTQVKEFDPITTESVWRIWVCGEEETVRMQFPPNFVLASSPFAADYIIGLNAFYCDRFDNYPLLFEIKRGGAVLTEIFAVPQPRPVQELSPMDAR